MRRILRLIVAAFLLTGWLLAAAALHVIVLPGGSIGVVPKDHLGFTDTYVDARAWTPADAALHPALVKRLVEAGRADWLSTVAGTPGESLDAKLKELLSVAGATPAGATEKSKAPAAPNRGPH